MAQTRRGEVREVGGGDGVVKVADVRHYARFEVLGVRSATEHFGVVVGFDHKGIGGLHIVVGAGSYVAGVSDDDEAHAFAFDREADIVSAVVRDFEGCDGEPGDVEGKFFVDRDVVVFDAARDAVAAQEAVECLGGAVEAHVAMIAQERVGIFDVVAVIVGQDYAFDGRAVDAVMEELVGYIFAVDTGIDEDAALICADISTVSAAAAAERDETQGAAGLDADFGYVGFDRDDRAGAAHDDVAGDVVPADVDVIKESGQIVERA